MTGTPAKAYSSYERIRTRFLIRRSPNARLSFFVELDCESQQALSDNNLTIDEVLRQAGIDATVTYGNAPYAAETGTKELATIILASGASALLISYGIAKILRVYLNRPKIAEISEVVEIRDPSGRVLIDNLGRPQFKTQKRLEIAQPHDPKTTTDHEMIFGPKHGVVIRLRDANSGNAPATGG